MRTGKRKAFANVEKLAAYLKEIIKNEKHEKKRS